jgi:hypothetical protein
MRACPAHALPYQFELLHLRSNKLAQPNVAEAKSGTNLDTMLCPAARSSAAAAGAAAQHHPGARARHIAVRCTSALPIAAKQQGVDIVQLWAQY